MKASIVQIPIADISQPPLGIAQIIGYLYENNSKDIMPYDLSIDFINYCLDKNVLMSCYKKIEKRLEYLENCKSEKGLLEYRILFESYIDGKYIIENIEKTVDNLKKIQIYDNWNTYSKYANIMEKAFKLYGSAFYPTTITQYAVTFTGSEFESENIINKIQDIEENPFILFYQLKLKEIIQEDTKFLGISINYSQQLIPGLTLAKMAKMEYSDLKVILGGSIFTSYMDRLEVFTPFVGFVDAIIPSAGEIPWLNIMNDLPFDDLGNCMISIGKEFRRTHKIEKSVKRVLPNFDGFNLKSYIVPKMILPFSLSVGCYWGKCSFCSYTSYNNDDIIKNSLDSLSEKVIKNLNTLNEKYDSEIFYFVDEAIPPSFSEKFSSLNNKNQKQYKWYGEMRFDSVLTPEFVKKIKEGGCSLIIFGLESGNDRVLNVMKKGTNLELIENIINECKNAELKIMTMFFLGFPTETIAEANDTINLIKRHLDVIVNFGVSNFILLRTIPVYYNAKEYGIEIIRKNEDLAIDDNYIIEQGISQETAKKLVESIDSDEIIKNYSSYSLLARSHLIFLPLTKEKFPKFEREVTSRKATSLNKCCYFFDTKYDLFNHTYGDNKFYYVYNAQRQNIYLLSKECCELLKSYVNQENRKVFIENYNVNKLNKEKVEEFLDFMYKEEILRG